MILDHNSRYLWVVILGITGLLRSQDTIPQASVASPEYLYEQITAIDQGGQFVYGLLLGTTPDSIHILQKGASRSYAHYDLRSISIAAPAQNSSSLSIGLFSGIYLAQYLFVRANGQPAAFMLDIQLGNFFGKGGLFFPAVIALAGSAVGVGTAWLVGNGKSNEAKRYEFSKYKEDGINPGWEEFQKTVSGEPVRTHWNLMIHTGKISGSLYGSFRTFSESHDYSEREEYCCYSSLDGRSYRKTGRYNLARRFTATYQVRRKLALGGAISFLHDPVLVGRTAFSDGYQELLLTMSMKGYYLMLESTAISLNYIPLNFSLGAGLGAVNYKIGFHGLNSNFNNSTFRVQNNSEGTAPSAFGYVGIEKVIAGHTVISLTADYVFIPAEVDIAAYEGLNLPKSSHGLSSWSVGLAFGYRL